MDRKPSRAENIAVYGLAGLTVALAAAQGIAKFAAWKARSAWTGRV